MILEFEKELCDETKLERMRAGTMDQCARGLSRDLLQRLYEAQMVFVRVCQWGVAQHDN